MKRIAALAALTTVAIAAPQAAHAAPKAGTFAGSLGISVPKGAQADVRAISRADGTVIRTKAAGKTGAFSLSLPAGQYLMVGTVMPQPGKGAKITETRIGVSLKAGQKRTKATIKRKKKRKAKRKLASAAFVQEKGQVTAGQLAVEIPALTGATGEYRFMNQGIAELLIDDILNGTAGKECDVHVIEVLRRDELIKELEFQQSEYVDPASRVERNFILGDVEIRGTLKNGPNDDSLGYDIRLVDKRSGEELSRLQGSIDGEDFFKSEQEGLGKRVSEELCKLTDTYEVTLNVTGAATFATHSAGGTLNSTLIVKRATKKSPIYRGTGTLGWAGTTYSSKLKGCSYIDPVEPTVPWSVTLTNLGNGDMLVEWQPDGNDLASASVLCPGDPTPPPIPGQPGPSLIQTMPPKFQLPVAGGVQPLTGGFSDGGDGWFNTGTITVRPKGVAKLG